MQHAARTRGRARARRKPWSPPRGARVSLALMLALLGSAGAVAGADAIPTRNVQVIAHVDDFPPTLGPYGYSACWGYVHPDGREYAAIGTYHGTAIYALDTPASPRLVATIPGPFSAWREVKQYRTWLYIVSEGTDAGEGLQIVRMTDPEHPVLATTWATTFVRAHTVSVDTTRALLVCNGTRDTIGTQLGMHVLSLADPEAPVELARWPAGTAAVPDSEYTHDCVMVGTRLYASSIYAGILRVFDLADPTRPTLLRQWTYPGAFTHSSWPDSSGAFLYLCDERIGEPLKVFEVANLATPMLANQQTCNPGAIVHNPRVRGHELYLANYTEGVRVLDVSDPAHPAEFGFADTYAGPSGDFSGVWETFPYFPSGLVIASDRNSGLWVLRAVRNYALVRLELTDAGAAPAAARLAFPAHASHAGAGLAGAHVSRDGLDSLVTPGDGVTVWALDPGSHTLRVKAFGYPETTLTVSVAAGERDTLDLVLAPLPLGAYTGRVRDAASGAPLEDAEVMLDYTPVLAHTDATGAFDLGAVPSDRYRIEAHAPGYVPAVLTRSLPADSTRETFALARAPLHDDCEQPTAWTAGVAGDDATGGAWIRVEPLGTYAPARDAGSLLGRTDDRVALPAHDHGAELDPLDGPAQPGADRTPGAGRMCWVTGQGTDPAKLDEADVDNGHTTLVTPPLGCATFVDPVVGYWSWFYTNTPADPGDFLRIDVSNDGVNWIVARTVTGMHDVWTEGAVRLRDLISTPSNAVQVRFVANDGGPASIVEAAIDELTVYEAPASGVAGAAPANGPARFTVGAATPNPSSGSIAFRLELPAAGHLDAEVFDLAGRRVQSLAHGVASAGARTLEWDGRDARGASAPPGLYFARVRFAGDERVLRLVRAR